MNDKEKAKLVNKSEIQKALKILQKDKKKVSTQEIELHTGKMHKLSLSKVVIDNKSASELGDFSLRITSADLGLRYTIHDRNSKPSLTASASIEAGEIAFIQMYLTYDHRTKTVLITSNVEVSDNYNGEDLQGYGIGSSFMPNANFDAREAAVRDVVRQYFPDTKQFVIMLKDFARGKSGKDRKNWTTDLAVAAGYTEKHGKLVKTISLN